MRGDNRPGTERRPAPLRFGRALAYGLRLGCISFGGPAGRIAPMHEELVERRRWISERFEVGVIPVVFVAALCGLALRLAPV